MSPLVLPLLALGEKLLDKFFTTPEEKAAAQLELLKLEQDGELKNILGQLEVNAREAAHPSMFVAGWRPAVGWICALGLGYQTILHNLIGWLSHIYGWTPPPAPDTDTLLYILGAMLGIGALRTYEKKSGVTK